MQEALARKGPRGCLIEHLVDDGAHDTRVQSDKMPVKIEQSSKDMSV
jgi:hypothetical protein